MVQVRAPLLLSVQLDLPYQFSAHSEQSCPAQPSLHTNLPSEAHSFEFIRLTVQLHNGPCHPFLQVSQFVSLSRLALQILLPVTGSQSKKGELMLQNTSHKGVKNPALQITSPEWGEIFKVIGRPSSAKLQFERLTFF